MGLHFPKWMTALLFGKPREKSREMAAVKDAYFARLSEGAGAGVFTPLSITNPEQDDKQKEEQQDLLASWRKLSTELADAIEDYTESDLDSIRMPHPVMGPIPIREMLIFALLHEQHHLENVKKKLN